MSGQELIQIIMALLGSLGFGIIFQLRGKKLMLAALGGGLTWGVYLACHLWIADAFVCCFLASAFAAGYAEVMARILKAPASVFTMPAEISLIPGSSLYNTMYAVVSGDEAGFLAAGRATVTTALAIALGIVLVMVITGSAASFRKPGNHPPRARL